MREELISLRNWGPAPNLADEECKADAVVHCGWGRLLFGQTYSCADTMLEELRCEAPGQRDVALYIRDPQVVIAQAPQELFMDPSLTYRLSLMDALSTAPGLPDIEIRELTSEEDLPQINRIYQARGMVPVQEGFIDSLETRNEIIMLAAWDLKEESIIGVVTGVDHRRAFGDPDNGSSLWALAVDPQCAVPGVGTALVLELAQHFQDRGRSMMDLSVMHSNEEAIQLYQDLGFEQVPVYCVKNRNAINEELYTGPRSDRALNPYAKIITEEASRRGIAVAVTDARAGLFCLSLGGRVIHCRESLTDATSAVAAARCDDKALTRRLLQAGGLHVPDQVTLDSEQDAVDFLERHGSIVIKPARGEQGRGVAVALRKPAQVKAAFLDAKRSSDCVLAEQYIEGQDLRIIVIDGEVVAAAIRKPATIVGTDRHTVRQLIEKQSRRRRAATGGESSIPLDEETHRCLESAGFGLDDILPGGLELEVRKTANLHTGGTLHDVTHELHPALTKAAVKAASLLDIPVVGMDMIVKAPESMCYHIIEANERPGLANHEPQPTAARLLDFLFPTTSDRGHTEA